MRLQYFEHADQRASAIPAVQHDHGDGLAHRQHLLRLSADESNEAYVEGLQANLSYTFSKALTSTRQDIFNPASSTKSIQSTDQPHVLAINFLYQTQTYFTNHLAALITRDWQFGSFLQYASGVPLTPPVATTTNNLPGGSEMYRTGQPLYLKDLNCHCFDPTHEPVAAGIVRKHLQPHVSGGAYHVESTGAAGQKRLRAADRRLRRHQ